MAATAGSTQLASQDVGLIFVREYYTFLNKKPHRLHAFYNKDSLFIRGDEGTVTTTYKGQEEIGKKIQECQFEDCKVLVTQVDSQVSANNGILIQVLGEMCNHDGPSQKFSQTFFLATQPNGYFVLNDIFRFLKDEVEIDYYTVDQVQEQPKPTETVVIDITPSPVIHSAIIPEKQEPVVEPVKEEKKQEEKKQEPVVKKEQPKKVTAETPPVVEEPKKVEPVKEEPVAVVVEEKKKPNNKPVTENKQPQQKKEQKKEPKETKEQKEVKESKPSAPKSWATLASTPAAAPVSATASPTPAAATTAVAAEKVTPVSPVVATNEKTPPAQPTQPTQQQPTQQQNKAQPSRKEATNIFVKLVTEAINEDQLTEAFNKIGSVKSCSISRVRNCAFIEFYSPESCTKALAQHRVPVGSNNHIVLAEERRFTNQNNNNNNRFNNNNQGRPQNNNNQPYERRNNNNQNNNNNNRRGNNTPQQQQQPQPQPQQQQQRTNNQGGKGRGAPNQK